MKLLAVGDISFYGRNCDNPRKDVFSSVKHFFRSADLIVCNLENPLTGIGSPTPGKCTLRGAPDWAVLMKEAGINLVSLANNHMMDYGAEGLYDTICALDLSGIRHVGAGENKEEACAPVFVSAGEMSIAFLARSSVIVSSQSYAGHSTPGVAFLEPDELIHNIKICKKKADLVVVLLHWGLEDYAYPTPAQKSIARQLVEAGADAILGHHPHVLQGIQRINESVIAYSLGNFLFDDFMWKPCEGYNEMMFTLSVSNRRGMILQMSWNETKNLECSEVFTRINADGHIVPDSVSDRTAEFKTISKGINRPLYSYWWRLYALSREWDLRVKHKLNFERIRGNIWKIRPRHIKELMQSLRKSTNIARGKSTNPYD